MAQYQSFPGAAGDSRTLDKLKALRLPDLEGRSFFDVGCNEGFFCGFAHFQGADRSVGVDHSRQFIERARRRFPACEFFQQGWESLPDGPFDVILLASAIHYAEDQADLLHRLMALLSADGVLILELGIVSSKKSEWVKVKRGIDDRFFPTMPKLREVLRDYAWKWMGPSVSQAGDPVPRHVIHISPKRPIAYLLLQPPAYGKTSIAASLFAPAHVPVVSGDELVDRAASKKIESAPELFRVLTSNYSPFALDRTIQQVFALGLGGQLVDLWLSQVKKCDFALDAYIPVEHHAMVEETLADAGYLPVLLRWERVGPRLLSGEVLARRSEEFYLSMAGHAEDQAAASATPGEPVRNRTGFVDDLKIADSKLLVRGWAFDSHGALPSGFALRLGEEVLVADRLEKQMRPDVQRHAELPHALVGYRFQVEVPGLDRLEQLQQPPEVFATDGGQPVGNAFRFASSVSERLTQVFQGGDDAPQDRGGE